MSRANRIKEFFASPKGRVSGLWLSYFLYWGSIAPFIPYVGLYYESVGLSGTQIGTLNSVRALVSFVSAIAIAFLTDLLRRRKLVFVLCILGMIVALFIFPFALSFVTLLPIIALYSAFQAPAIAILDQDTLSTLENPRNYSKVRVGGSYGWGIIILFAGLIIDRPGTPLTIIFALHIFFLLFLLALVAFLPKTDPSDVLEKASFQDVVDLFRRPGFALWMGMIFLFGMAEASLINFLFLHIQNIGGSASLMGLSMTFAILGEIIGFNFARRLQGRVGSRRMIVIAFAIRTIWYILIGLNHIPLLVLPIQILAGGSFSLIEAGSVAYVNERSPSRIGTTAQGVRSSILLRISAAIGSLFAGAIYQRSGSSRMYLIMAIVSAASFILAVILRNIERRREGHVSL
jgi:MFS transporter, PPP family, 3-phenylpropionic acid transporter